MYFDLLIGIVNSSEEPEKRRQAPLPPEDSAHQAARGPGEGVPKPGDDSPHLFGMYTTDAKRWNTSLKDFARTNRKNPTPAENHLWQELRGNKRGAPFRRQHAVGPFIVDFVCLAAWLIIEVDGGIHGDESRAEYDGGRTHELQENGFLVLRFTNEEVLHNTSDVLKTISEHLTALYPNYEPR